MKAKVDDTSFFTTRHVISSQHRGPEPLLDIQQQLNFDSKKYRVKSAGSYHRVNKTDDLFLDLDLAHVTSG